MPELPDLTLYLEALSSRVLSERLERIRIASPFVLRSVEPPVSAAAGRKVLRLSRVGKRIVFELEDALSIIVHLMIAGRFRWKEAGAPIPKKVGLAAFDFGSGSLLLTEVSKKKRASIQLASGRDALAAFDRGGLEVLEADLSSFREALTRENHTLKRSLTDPRLFAGIGNAYSDEILHRARLSPMKLTTRLDDEESARLHRSSQEVLTEWIERLRAEAGDGFPEKVTAFREGMAVHGRFKKSCPSCGDPVQRIRYAANECNYCATCQTGGKLLADRALSRLLKSDWPRTLEELKKRTLKD